MSETAEIQKEIASASAMCDELGKLLTKAPYVQPTRSESIGNLVKALAAAQKEYKPLKKSSINPFYTTDKKVAKYAELADVIEATQGALANHGLAVIQRESTDLGTQEATVETVLAHESGEWMSSSLTLPAVGKGYNNTARFDAQTIGAAFTYGRRYSLQAMVGISAEPDDDANSLSQEPGTKEAAQDVAKAKIAQLQASVATQAASKTPTPSQPSALHPSAPNGPAKANLESIGDIVKGFLQPNGVKEKLTKGKQKYLSIEVVTEQGEAVTMQYFDNKELPGGSTTFGLLTIASGLGEKVPVRFKVTNNGRYINVRAPELIYRTEFDSDGVPVIQRDEEPPLITDDDLPEMFHDA